MIGDRSLAMKASKAVGCKQSIVIITNKDKGFHDVVKNIVNL